MTLIAQILTDTTSSKRKAPPSVLGIATGFAPGARS